MRYFFRRTMGSRWAEWISIKRGQESRYWESILIRQIVISTCECDSELQSLWKDSVIFIEIRCLTRQHSFLSCIIFPYSYFEIPERIVPFLHYFVAHSTPAHLTSIQDKWTRHFHSVTRMTPYRHNTILAILQNHTISHLSPSLTPSLCLPCHVSPRQWHRGWKSIPADRLCDVTFLPLPDLLWMLSASL